MTGLFLTSLRSDIGTRQAAGTRQRPPKLSALTPEFAVGAVAAPWSWAGAAFEQRIKVGTGPADTPTEELGAQATAILHLERP